MFDWYEALLIVVWHINWFVVIDVNSIDNFAIVWIFDKIMIRYF